MLKLIDYFIDSENKNISFENMGIVTEYEVYTRLKL